LGCRGGIAFFKGPSGNADRATNRVHQGGVRAYLGRESPEARWEVLEKKEGSLFISGESKLFLKRRDMPL